MRWISILGDSVSTYEGFNPEGYAVFYSREMQQRNEIAHVTDTWWGIVLERLSARLCVNNSYSGSRVVGGSFPAATSVERIRVLRTENIIPDIILVYMGFNDFGAGTKVWRKGLELVKRRDLSSFSDAYTYLLSEIRKSYPNTSVICGTLMRTMIRNREWDFPEFYGGIAFSEYNKAIRRACRKTRCFLADLGALNYRYETLDGSHPTASGHRLIANAWLQCLDKK